MAKTKPTSKKATPGFKGAGGPPPLKGAPKSGGPAPQKISKPKAK